MSRKFMFPRKTAFKAVALGLLSCSASVSPVVACDPPVAKPVVVSRSLAVVVQSRPVDPVEDQLLRALKATQEFVHTCHNDVERASKAVEAVGKEQAKLTASQNIAEERVTALRNLLREPGCSICLDGKSFSKETVAEALLGQLEVFEANELRLETLAARLQQAKIAFNQAEAKAKRWDSVEQLLVSRVDKALTRSKLRQSQAEKEAAAKQAAVAEALALVETIEAQIAKTTQALKPVSHTAIATPAESNEMPAPTGSEGSLGEKASANKNSQAEVDQPIVGKVIAEFDAIFGK